jgi:polysaccharide chain length determinant protein (PEP-CTERM system associated)
MATDATLTLGDYFDVVRRRWIFLATILPAAILIAVYTAFTLPPMYRSLAAIMLEPSSIPADMIRTTVTAYADQQLELVRRRVMTKESMARVVEEIDPYPGLAEVDAGGKAELIVQNTQIDRVDPITLLPLQESNAFAISYDNPDPAMAQAVTSRLADMFLSHNRESRTEQATETYSFLKSQSEEASRRIAELEQKLADFKTQYGDALPDSRGRNQESMDRVERDLDTLQQQILLANERKRTFEVQLSQINPNLFNSDGNWRLELDALRAQLAAARQRYTEDHPDIIRLRRAIDTLGARIEQSDPATLAPDNPDYIQVANQLDTVEREIAALESNAARARQQIEQYERSLRIAPEVEREYSQLLRDYEVARQRFANIENSLSTAALGQEMESEARGDRLTLIRPANRPGKPDSPNRLGIILIGFVLGSGLAVGLAALAESSDPTIRSARDLSELTDIKPLASVPYMLNSAERHKRMVKFATASVIAVFAILFVGSAVVQAAN